MVLQLGNWRWTKSNTPWHGSQSVSQSARQSLRQSVNASSCRYVLLGANKIMWPTFAGGAFRGILLLANGQFKGSRRRCSCELMKARIGCCQYWLPVVCFAMPKLLYRFAQYVCTVWCIAYITPSTGIDAHPWAEQATTLTSLISGMRGNVAI